MKPERSSIVSRSNRPGRYALSRRSQWPLLALTLCLALALVLIRVAQDPKLGQWLALHGNVSHTDKGEALDTQLQTPADKPLPGDVFRAARPAGPVTQVHNQNRSGTDTDTKTAEGNLPPRLPVVPASAFQVIKDDTVFRPAEYDVWFRSMEQIRRMSGPALMQLPAAEVGFAQLFRQPDSYRGRVVGLSGTIKRSHYVRAHENPFGIDGYWQCWLQPVGSLDPIVVYVPELPAEFPAGQDVHEDVRVTGVFFKRWAYESKSGIRSAPLVLGSIVSWPWVGSWTEPAGTSTAAEEPSEAVQELGPVTAQSAEGDPADVDTTIGCRDYLARLQVGDEVWAALAQGSPEPNTPNPSLLRLLSQMNRIPAWRIHGWQQSEIPWPALPEATPEYLGQCYHFSGRLRGLRRHLLKGDAEERYGLREYFECLVESPDSPHPFVVWTREIPLAWRDRLDTPGAPDERIRGSGIFVGRIPSAPGLGIDAGESGTAPPMAFAATRLSWHPDRPQPEWQITSDHVRLANLGVDLGSLDTVTERKALMPGDRDAFYGLLSAMRRVPSEKLTTFGHLDVKVSDLLTGGAANRGRLCTFTGTARRAVLVHVDDRDAIARYGMRTYYELEVFVETDARIRVKDDRGTAKEFATYPLVFCCRELPRDFPTGDAIHVPVTITGAYLKNWAYRTQFMSHGWPGSPSAEPRPYLQTSPLLLGRAPVVAPLNPYLVPDYQSWLLAGFFVVLAGIGGALWWFSRGDQRSSLARHRRQEAPPNFDELPC